MKGTCRFCAEPIDPEAARCPHCGEALREGAAPPPPAKSSLKVVLLVLVIAVFGFVCLIGMIAAVAVPNLIDARRHGNEAAAIGALKTIYTAEVLYREGDKDQDGLLDYGDLQELSDASLVDSVLGSGRRQGYVFQVAVSPTAPEDAWMATASPMTPGTTGTRYFMINQDGVIYHSTTAPFAITPDCAPPPGALPVGR